MHSKRILLFNTVCVVPRDNIAIRGYNDRIVQHVSTMEECIRICIQETSFVCKSVNYCSSGPENEECYLSVENTASVSDSDVITSVNDLYELCEYL